MVSDSGPHGPPARPSSKPGALSALLLWASLSACGDPVKDLAAKELGPESSSVVEGPLHRPGQPCLVCHDGVKARAYSIAGTVYRTSDSDQPAAGTSVHLIDTGGRRLLAVANCAGNFFVKPEEFAPRYPLWVSLSVGSLEVAMDSPINGEGSCARCHGMDPGPGSAGRVYVFAIAPELPAEACR
jgi:hypothetical protein